MAEPRTVAGRWRPYLVLVGAQLRAQSSYRVSFGVEVFTNLWATVFDIVTVLVMFRVTRQLGGFDLRSSMVIAGLAAFAFAAADLLVGNVDQLRRVVRTGQFDALLLRPLAALPQLVAMELPLRKLGRAGFGLTVYLVAVAVAGIDWSPGRLLLAVIAPVAGMIFFGSIFVIGATVVFWWIESGELASSFTYGGRDFATYPMTVYSGRFRRLFAYAMGFAFVAYYPALALLGRADPLGLPSWTGWVSPLAAAVAAGAAAAFWRVGVRHYRSTGS